MAAGGALATPDADADADDAAGRAVVAVTPGTAAPDVATEGLPFASNEGVEDGVGGVGGVFICDGKFDAAGKVTTGGKDADWAVEVPGAAGAVKGVAQPVSHMVMARRQIDVNFIGIGLR